MQAVLHFFRLFKAISGDAAVWLHYSLINIFHVAQLTLDYLCDAMWLSLLFFLSSHSLTGTCITRGWNEIRFLHAFFFSPFFFASWHILHADILICMFCVVTAIFFFHSIFFGKSLYTDIVLGWSAELVYVSQARSYLVYVHCYLVFSYAFLNI